MPVAILGEQNQREVHSVAPGATEPVAADGPEEGEAGLERIKLSRDAQISMRLPGGFMSGLIEQESVPLAPHSCYRRYGVEKFFDSPCVIYNGKPWKRKWLVNKFANKRSFAHIDWTGNSPEYQLLARSGEWLTISGRSAILYEFLSIGQILACSASAHQLRNRVQELKLGPLE